MSLTGRLRTHMRAGLRGSTRAPRGFTAHQHLCWALEALDSLIATGAGNATTDTAVDQRRYLLGTVLPAVTNDLWLDWHGAVWEGAAADGPLLLAGGATACAAGAGDAPARVLHGAAETAAAMAVVVDCAGAVADRAPRVYQLRLAAAHLLSNSHSSSTHPHSGPTQGVCTVSQQDHHTWISLASLTSHILWSDRSSLPDPASQDQLSNALHTLVQTATNLTPTHDLSHMADTVVTLLATSVHTVLVGLLESLVRPLLRAVCEGVTALCVAAHTGHGTQGYTTVRRVGVDKGGKGDSVGLQGRCWVLLGGLRLHLVAPPLGVDPAGKYALKAEHKEQVMTQVITPEAAVRAALAALPGGPDESAPLAALAADHAAALAAAQRARTRCVPRPTPPRYIPLARDVADFAASVAAVPRVLQLVSAAGAAAGGADARRARDELAAWVGMAGAWSARLGKHYPEYADIIRPVQLAVAEIRLGMGMLSAHVAVDRPVAAGPAASAADVVRALLQFPASDSRAAVLAGPAAATVTAAVACAAARRATAQVEDPAKRDRTAEMAAYGAELATRHAALQAEAAQLLTAGAAAVSAGDSGLAQLQRFESLLSGFVDSWSALKAYEERVAAEEADMFKSKTRSTHIATEEVRGHTHTHTSTQILHHSAPFHTAHQHVERIEACRVREVSCPCRSMDMECVCV